MSTYKVSELVLFIRAANAVHGMGVVGSGKFGYALALNKRRLRSIGETFDEQVKALIDKYAEKDENGQNVTEGEGPNVGVKITDLDAFNAALREIDNMEVEVNLHKVKIDDLPAQIGASVIDHLFPMIDGVVDENCDTGRS